MILGLWAALIPFVGPYFNLSMHNDQTWFWMTDRLWLNILPGACAFLGGLILMSSGTRISARTGALLAAAGGIWLVAGPTVSMLWHHGQIAVGPPIFGFKRQALEWFAMYYGVGAIITALSSYAYGMLTTRPVVAEDAAAGAATGYGAGRFSRRRDAGDRTAVGAGAGAAGGAYAGDRSATGDRPATATRRRGGLMGRFRRNDGDTRVAEEDSARTSSTRS